MKKLILAVVAVAALGMCASSAEAGRYARRAVRGGVYAPVVRVAPRYVRPVVVAPVAPVYVRRPAYIYDYGYRYRPAPVIVRGSGYYGVGGVHIRVPGLGLDVRY